MMRRIVWRCQLLYADDSLTPILGHTTRAAGGLTIPCGPFDVSFTTSLANRDKLRSRQAQCSSELAFLAAMLKQVKCDPADSGRPAGIFSLCSMHNVSL